MFWILEAFIWLMIVAIIAGGIVFYKYETNQIHPTYQIFLPDVDGLIIGSPVKYMGIQIGYIKDIKIIEDRVLLKFIITEKNIKLPNNTIATVEFYGLGGSKSLELYPPVNKDYNSADIIIAQPPKKIADSLKLLYKMFDNVSEIMYVTSNFMSKMGVIKKDVNFVKDTGDDLKNRANILFKKDLKENE
jgi:phospholipid/cholesterol/gamma-HCH transport system substrate-binding protein